MMGEFNDEVTVLIVIPARGGSKGIPRKNLRILAKKPLLYYSITNALSVRHRADVVVSSEDEEILALAVKMGAGVHNRPAQLSDDSTTLDPVIYDAYRSVSKNTGRVYDLVVTLQPTSPLLRSDTLNRAIEMMMNDLSIDTLLSATRKVGLSWKKMDGRFIPNYTRRLNRQELEPVYYETGGFLICRPDVISPETRLGSNVQLFELEEEEAIDIDTYEEWNLCAYLLNRKKIVFVTLGYPEVGLGHIYRTLLLADRIVNHEVHFVVDHRSELGLQKIKETHHPVSIAGEDQLKDEIIDAGPDLVITDRLDTDTEYMQSLTKAGIKTINFEDLGPGSTLADVLINALYPPEMEGPNRHFGASYFCGRQEFLLSPYSIVKRKVSTVLLTFGGTDPNNLTLKTLQAIYSYCRDKKINITVIAGLGYAHYDQLEPIEGIEVYKNVKNISDYMLNSDLAFTSAGRTIYELAMLGVPTIVQAQNEREQTHFFADEAYGFINLGLGVNTQPDEILEALILLEDFDKRKQMQQLMRATDLRQGIDRVVRIIDQTIAAL